MIELPNMDPIENSMNMKEISPTVAPRRSFRSNSVGPIIPPLIPNTVNTEIKDMQEKMIGSTQVNIQNKNSSP